MKIVCSLSSLVLIVMLGLSNHAIYAKAFAIRVLQLSHRTIQTYQWTDESSHRRHQLSHSVNGSTESIFKPNVNDTVTANTEAIAKPITGITLKIALDANGGVACRSEIRPERFTCSESLDMVHRLRSQSDAILIGVGTAMIDNPSLLVRRLNITIATKQPLRVMIDPTLRFIPSAAVAASPYQLLTDGYPLVIYHCVEHPLIDPTSGITKDNLPSTVRLHYMKPAPVNTVNNPNDDLCISVRKIFEHLQENYNVQQLMVEGGVKTAQLFLRSKFVDRCILVHAPIKFSDPILSNITPSVLQSANLIKLGSVPSGVDVLECWSRPNLPWPTSNLGEWP